MPTVAITTATQAIPAGATATVKVAGSLPVYLDDATFKNNWQIQLEMQGFTIDTIAVQGNYGVISRDWAGSFVGRYAARSSVDGIVAATKTAAENAGSFGTTATIPSYGQPDQPTLGADAFSNVANSLGQGLSGLFEGIGSTAKAIPQIPILLIGGIVILGALIAFGPSFKGTGKAVAARLPL